jgi:hypothetical protein
MPNNIYTITADISLEESGEAQPYEKISHCAGILEEESDGMEL